MHSILLLVALAAGPTPTEALIAKLPTLELPQNFDKLPAGKPLKPNEVVALVLEPAEKHKAGSLGPLRRLWEPDYRAETKAALEGKGEGRTLTLSFHAVIRFNDTVRLIVASLVDHAPMSDATSVWLLTVVGGEVIDGGRVRESNTSEVGSVEFRAQLTKLGALTFSEVANVAIVDLEGLEEVRIDSAGDGELDSGGHFIEHGLSHATTSGRYTDAKTEEAMTVIDDGTKLRVFYQSKKQPRGVELKVEKGVKPRTFTVQFPKAKAKYPVSVDAGSFVLTSTNPDGSKQAFQRTW